MAPAKKPDVVWSKIDVNVTFAGDGIVLPTAPGKIPVDEAIQALERYKLRMSDDAPVQVFEVFDAYPHDAAVAVMRAMAKIYKWTTTQTQVIHTLFGDLKRPPTMLAIKVGPNDGDVIQCPLGQFILPGVADPITTMFHPMDDGTVKFVMHGTVKKRDQHVVLELATEAKRFLREESIYRGKPIRVGVNDADELDTSNPPIFLDVSEMEEEGVMFDQDITDQIVTSILVPLKATAACREHKIPLKRNALLSGHYGVGKSLLARLVARVAQQHGWTFILLDKVQGLRAALEFANRYAPAVVFAEDIDRIAENRDEAANDLMNTIDGVVSKSSEVMTILTTNHIEKLNQVILRPGRLDAIIDIRAPGPDTVRKLIRHYAGPLVNDQVDLKAAIEILAGQIPASIRECVERAKLGMINRKDTSLSGQDLFTAAQTMGSHLTLLNANRTTEASPAQKLAESLHAVVNNGFGQKIDALVEVTEEIKSYVS